MLRTVSTSPSPRSKTTFRADLRGMVPRLRQAGDPEVDHADRVDVVLKIHDRIAPGTVTEDEDIGPRAAPQLIASRTAVQAVVSGPTVQAIIALACREGCPHRTRRGSRSPGRRPAGCRFHPAVNVLDIADHVGPVPPWPARPSWPDRSRGPRLTHERDPSPFHAPPSIVSLPAPPQSMSSPTRHAGRPFPFRRKGCRPRRRRQSCPRHPRPRRWYRPIEVMRLAQIVADTGQPAPCRSSPDARHGRTSAWDTPACTTSRPAIRRFDHPVTRVVDVIDVVAGHAVHPVGARHAVDDIIARESPNIVSLAAVPRRRSAPALPMMLPGGHRRGTAESRGPDRGSDPARPTRGPGERYTAVFAGPDLCPGNAGNQGSLRDRSIGRPSHPARGHRPQIDIAGHGADVPDAAGHVRAL